MQFHAIFTQFHTILAISAIFWSISTCWESKCMYSSWEIQWWYFHAIFTQFSRNFSYFSQFWANFNMLGIKMHVLELSNSIVILSHTFTHSVTQYHTIFTQFWLFQPFLGQFQRVWYQKVWTRAEKFIGGTGRGRRPLKGAEGLQRGPLKSPLQELDFLVQRAKIC